MKVTIEQVAIDQVKDMLGELRDKYKPVMVRSINKTLSTVQTQAVARVGNKVNLKAARIKQDFRDKKANYSDISGAIWAVDAQKNRIGLMQYGAKQVMKGVTVKIKRDKKRFLIPHAFIATVKGKTSETDREHVFWRRKDRDSLPTPTRWLVGKKANARWSSIPRDYRYKLSRRTGPSVAYWFSNSDIFDPVSIQAQFVYMKNVETEVDSIIRRYGG